MAFITAALVGAGGSLLGGLLGSKGASNAAQTQANAATEAAKIQAESADKALALQKQMYEQQVARNQPYVGAGLSAQNRLMSMLGLQADPRYAGSQATNALYQQPQSMATSTPAPVVQSREQLRQQLLAQYTTPAAKGQWINGVGMDQIGGGYGPDTPASIDEVALNAEIDRLYGQQQQAQQQWQTTQAQANQMGQAGAIPGEDPYFNMYGQAYKAAPDFSMETFQQDPGYAFRLSEGLKALDRTAAARGGLISGGAMKAASRYGQDMASQEYQAAFNRYNQNRNFNTDLYQTNRKNALDPLGSLMSSGQNAANQMGAAGQNYGSNASSTYQQAGNAGAAGVNAAGQAGAAGQMGAANSMGNAINSAASSYSQASLLNALRGSTPVTNWGDTYLYGRE